MTSFLDTNYASRRVDRKSTSGTCQFLVSYLVSWSSKETKFCSPLNCRGGLCCGRGLLCTSPLDETTILDYDLHYDHIKIFCDNTSTIHMTKNANQHSKLKHIEIRYHFLRDH